MSQDEHKLGVEDNSPESQLWGEDARCRAVGPGMPGTGGGRGSRYARVALDVEGGPLQEAVMRQCVPSA